MLPPVSQRPRASLGRVLADLGDTLLELLSGLPDDGSGAHEREIDGIVIDDPDDEPVMPGLLFRRSPRVGAALRRISSFGTTVTVAN